MQEYEHSGCFEVQIGLLFREKGEELGGRISIFEWQASLLSSGRMEQKSPGQRHEGEK